MNGIRTLRAATIAWLVGTCLAVGTGRAAEKAPEGWKLAWADEFDGAAIDRSKWDFDLGNGFFSYDANQWIAGWGNGELQFYTREPENAFVTNGMLHIRALKESIHGCGYSSARMKTRARDGSALFSRAYGRFEFRAKLPTGRGIWPALWMLPQEDAYGTWAASGEIDVLEVRGHEPGKILGTLHYGSRWPANVNSGAEHLLPAGQTVADFHVYALEWEPGAMRWFFDGACYSTQTFWWSCSKMDGPKGAAPAAESDLNPWPAPFDRPFYLIMNLAVGGGFPGNPDATTKFPAEMLVDYVRVYERPAGPGPVQPRAPGRLPFGPK